MCSRIECPVCQRPTYAGCGRHVEQVLGDVPPGERCSCSSEPANPAATGSTRRWFGARAR